MNLISRLLPPSNVLLDLQASSKKRAFEQAGLLFENNHGIARATVFDSLFARERLGSTGLGQGVAIPHGRIKGLKEAVAAFVRLAQPVPFDAPDGKPVTLVFLLLAPEQATEQHLRVLSELAQMLSDREFRDRSASAQARFTRTSPLGSRMLQISVAQLYEDNREKLGLAWIGKAGSGTPLRRDSSEGAALVGHLNLIHPNRIQVLGNHEIAHLAGFEEAELFRMLGGLFAVHPAAIVVADGAPADVRLLKAAEASGVAVLATEMPGAQVIDRLRRYLGKALAESTERHGVCMDVLGLGVLITGDSGAGKSELALELVSRGHGLVADDIVEISRIAVSTLECRCPPVLKDFLEVRGLGVLDIRTIFGETAVRPKMNLRLIVHLERPGTPESTRLPLHELSEEILGVAVRKVVIPVAAGRNLAVLLEAAVRNYILQLRGIHSTAEFMERQRAEIKKSE